MAGSGWFAKSCGQYAGYAVTFLHFIGIRMLFKEVFSVGQGNEGDLHNPAGVFRKGVGLNPAQWYQQVLTGQNGIDIVNIRIDMFKNFDKPGIIAVRNVSLLPEQF
jgi:hypothetical protein